MSQDNLSREEIVPLLPNAKRQGSYLIDFCPSHPDGEKHHGRGGQSLSLSDSGVLKCHAGCSFKDIITALRERAGVVNEPTPIVHRTKYEVIVDGKVVATHMREDKAGKKRMWWEPKGVKPETLPLWRAWDLETLEDGSPVVICEGQKATDACWEEGIPAVGTYGASVIPGPEQLRLLHHFDVFTWADNDAAGEKLMEAVHANLELVGVQNPKVIKWGEAPPKGDAADARLAGVDFHALLSSAKAPREAAMEWEVDDERVVGRYQTPSGAELRFEAIDIHRDRIGPKATISINFGRQRLAFSNLHTHDRSKLVTLSNEAHNALGDILDSAVPKDVLKAGLDEFAFELFERFSGGIEIEELSGTAEPVAVTYIQNPYVIQNAGTVLFSPGGMGKTATAMLLAAAIHHGVKDSPLGVVPKPRKVLYVNIERDREGIRRRLGQTNTTLGLPRSALLPFISGRGKTLMDVLGRVKRAVRDEGYEIVFFDSISRAGMGSLNEDQTANRICDALNSLGCAWFGIAHMSKGEEANTIFGSVMFENAADITVRLRGEETERGLNIVLEGRKANDVPKPKARYLQYIFDPEYGLSGVSLGSAEDSPDLAAEVMTKTDLVRMVLERGEATANQVADELSMNVKTVRNVLNAGCRGSHGAFVKTRKDGRDQFFGLRSRANVPENVPEGTSPRAYGQMGSLDVPERALSLGVGHMGTSSTEPDLGICTKCGDVPADAYSDAGQPVCGECA